MDPAPSSEREPEGPQGPTVGAAQELRPASIGNRESLLTHGQIEPRGLALRVAEAGLAACDPGLAVERLVRLDDDGLVIDGVRHELDPDGRIVVLGSGKASLKIALALERILGERLHGGTVVVRHGAAPVSLERIELLEAAHPLPDERSVAAAVWLLEQAGELGERDLVIACFTGGSSALSSLPPAGVSPAEKRDLHKLLLGAGLPISEVNTVRKQVSGFKGGRLALAIAPARLINLSVSDVAGDPLDAITDPTVANDSTVADATSILRSHDLWGEVAGSIRRHLEDPRLTVPDLSGMEIHTTLLVTGETACQAMAAEARAAGANPVILSTGLEEEAGSVGRILGPARGRERPARSPLLTPFGADRVRRREHRPAQPRARVRDWRTQPGGGARGRRPARRHRRRRRLHRYGRIGRRDQPRRRDQRRRDDRASAGRRPRPQGRARPAPER